MNAEMQLQNPDAEAEHKKAMFERYTNALMSLARTNVKKRQDIDIPEKEKMIAEIGSYEIVPNSLEFSFSSGKRPISLENFLSKFDINTDQLESCYLRLESLEKIFN